MKSIEEYKIIFDKYDGIMRSKDLQTEKILYRSLQKLIDGGYVEKIRYGYYRWTDYADFSEISIVLRLFSDAVICMDTALRYYGYSDRTPREWHLMVSKDSSKSRFKIDYPFVKPYYVEPDILKIGVTEGEMDRHKVPIYDKDRVICDCLRYRGKMDKEIFNKAIQGYVTDQEKNISNLLKYAEMLRVKKTVQDLIGVWL